MVLDWECRIGHRTSMRKQTTLTAFLLQQEFEAGQDIVSDQAHFSLSPEKWDPFCAALDAPPRALRGLRKLLSEPSVFDEAD